MRALTVYALSLIWMLTLASCESEKQPATFYAIDSLVSGQVNFLTGVKARLYKEALLKGKTDTITFTPGDTVGWQKELDIFRKLEEINKPVNKERYEVSDGLLDRMSNLTVREFKSKEPLPVVYLKIYYHGNISKPRKIEALYDEENALYKSARLLSMQFHQVKNRTVLTSYSLKGGQKMALGDSVAFFISGKILID
jgi:hypothetical protein